MHTSPMKPNKGIYAVMLAVGVLMLGMGVVLLWFIAHQHRMQSWVQADANFKRVEIVNVRNEVNGEEHKAIATDYDYTYNDTSYHGNDVGAVPPGTPLEETVKRIKSDGRVWVNPHKPGEAVVLRPTTASYNGGLLIGVFFTLFGLLGIGGVYVDWSARRKAKRLWAKANQICFSRMNVFVYHSLAAVISVMAAGLSLAIQLPFLPTLVTTILVFQAVTYILVNRFAPLMSAKVSFIALPGGGRPVSCDISGPPSIDTGEKPYAAIRVQRLEQAVTLGVYRGHHFRMCLIGEFPLALSREFAGRLVGIARIPTTDDAENAGRRWVRKSIVKHFLPESESDMVLQYSAGMILTGARTDAPAELEQLKRISEVLQSAEDIYTLMILRHNDREVTAMLPPSFWTV